VAVAALAVLEAFALFTMPILTGGRRGAVEQGAVRFLRDQPGIVRSYTLGPIMPNYGAYFDVAMIDHNVLPVPRVWAGYVDAHVLPGVGPKSGGIIFWPGFPPYGVDAGGVSVRNHLADLRELGVDFVVSAPRDDLAGLRPAYRDPAMEVWAVPGAKPYFDFVPAGACSAAAVSREVMRVTCGASAVLVRRELFLPGWRAWVDGRPAAVTARGAVFQAVTVNAGAHEVRFGFAPPFAAWGWGLWWVGVLGLGWNVWRLDCASVWRAFTLRRMIGGVGE